MATVRTLFKEIVDLPELPPLDQGDGDSLSNDLVLSLEVNNLLLQVTQDQYVAILSALFNGAMTTYPDNYNNVIYPVIKAAKVEFCAAMLDCLLNDPDVRDQIFNMVNEAITSTTVVTPDGTKAGYEAIAASGCDLDTLWGQTGKLVDYINQVNVDWLENLNLISELSDKIEAILDIMPVLGDAVEAVVNFFSEVGNSLLASYNASWNDNLRDAIVCDLFCLAQDSPTCTLTIQDILDYLLDRYNISAGSAGLLDVLSMLTSFSKMGLVVAQGAGGVYSGDDMVYIAFIVQMVAVATGDRFFNVNNAGGYYAEMRDSIPSSGWESECPVCAPPVWDVTLDFTVSAYGFTALNGWGVHTPGVGFVPTNETISGLDQHRVYAYFDFGGDVNCTLATMGYNITKGTTNSGTARCLAIEQFVTQDFNSTANGTGLALSSGAVDLDVDFMGLDMITSRGSFGGSGAITSLRLTGTGIKPDPSWPDTP